MEAYAVMYMFNVIVLDMQGSSCLMSCFRSSFGPIFII